MPPSADWLSACVAAGMAEAVEGAEILLLGVSRKYKESGNCRLEAQYASQKKKPMVPLMLQEGYDADGWLGILLGTCMWSSLRQTNIETLFSNILT